MKKDAHYYALLAMARSVGIEKETAHKIAYASQFVDDAKVNKITLAADNPSDLLSQLGDEIINAATCHSYSDLSTYNYSSMTANTSAFHFVPAYGHGQVYSYPDIPYLEWRYEYDATDNFSSQYQVSRVKNNEIFIDAFKKIKDILQKFLENNEQYRDDSIVEVNYEEFHSILTTRKVEEERIDDWKDFMLANGLLSSSDQNIIEYYHNMWLKKAFKDFINCDFEKRIVNRVHLADDFLQSNWYKYYQGIQWYKQLFFKAAEKNGLSIPNSYS